MSIYLFPIYNLHLILPLRSPSVIHLQSATSSISHQTHCNLSFSLPIARMTVETAQIQELANEVKTMKLKMNQNEQEEEEFEQEEQEEVESTTTAAGGELGENGEKKKKKKNKKKKKKSSESGGGGGGASGAGGLKVLVKQSEPPTVPVRNMYSNEIYPEGQRLEYKEE